MSERLVNQIVLGVLVISVSGDRVRVLPQVRKPLKEFRIMGGSQLFLPGFLLSPEESRRFLAVVGRTREELLEEALGELLQYTGGWDLKDPAHPIVKARRALGKE